MKNLSIIILGLVIVVLGIVVGMKAPVRQYGSTALTLYGNSGSSTLVIASSTTATTTITANTNRYAVFLWNSGNNNVSCLMSATSTGFNYINGSIFLASSTGMFQFTPANDYIGQLWCLSQTGTSSVSVTVGR